MDASDRTYSLVGIILDRLVTEPELPVDNEIQSEDDIEWQELLLCNLHLFHFFLSFYITLSVKAS